MQFVPNPSIKGNENAYTSISVDVRAALKSWRTSLFAHEWITPDGHIKAGGELSDRDSFKRNEAEAHINSGLPLEMPILGIGILENIEIGSGKALFLTLADRGVTEMPVHIRLSQEKEFKKFIVK